MSRLGMYRMNCILKKQINHFRQRSMNEHEDKYGCKNYYYENSCECYKSLLKEFNDICKKRFASYKEKRYQYGPKYYEIEELCFDDFSILLKYRFDRPCGAEKYICRRLLELIKAER